MKRSNNPLSVILAFAIAGMLACATNSTSEPDDAATSTPGKDASVTPAPPPATPQDADWAAIEKLEREAKALAKTEGCSTTAECRTAPVGSRACGGPRYYIPYCAKSTDSAALFRRLDEVAKAEQAYNRKHNLASTCEMRLPPTVAVVAGACTAQ